MTFISFHVDLLKQTNRSTLSLAFWFLIFYLTIIVPPAANSQDRETESESRPEAEARLKPFANENLEMSTAEEKSSDDTNLHGNIPALEKYKHLFGTYRKTQLDAVKSIMNFGNEKQRYELVNVMLKQLFQTIEKAKQNLTSWGYMPGDPFPENETVRDGVSKVLENTAMFGDMVLRIPDIVHDLYDRQKEWQLLLAWSYGFCTQSNVFHGPHEQLLVLMAQEANIIDKRPNYVNPFKNEHKQEERKKFEEPPKKEKKKTIKKKRHGPRLSHTEL